MRKKITDTNKRRLAKNTLFLYILVFSNYFFALITVPYQTRVLGPELYGKIGWAMATMAYFTTVIEFGYLLSATERIARHREDKKEVEQIVGAVTINKLAVTILGLVFVASLSFTWDRMSSDPWFYILCYFASAVPSFMLDFFYRGIEEMQVITIRSVAIKAFFTVCIFLFLKDKSDYWVVPALQLIGGGLAVVFVYWHMVVKLHYRMVIPDAKYCWMIFRSSVAFFASRIANTLYISTNVFLLGIVYGQKSLATGTYTAAEKIVSVMNALFGPVADSLYPYMVRNKDFKLLKKILLLLMPPTIIGVVVIGYFAEPICVLLFGAEFRSVAPVLQLMLPLVVITLPTYLLGFPTLSALGGARAVNNSVIYGSILHLTMIAALFFSGHLTVTSVIIATIITDSTVVLYRAIAVRYYWKKMKANEL